LTETVRDTHRALAAGVLQRTGWFSTCKAETLRSFLDEGAIRLLQRGETLSRRGQPVEHLSLIVDGVLEVSATTDLGKRHVVRYLEPGQLMNLIPVLDGQAAIHDAVAHTDVVLLQLPKGIIQRALAAEPGFVQAVIRLLCLRSRLTYLDLSGNSLLTVRQRCARTLLHLLDPYGMPRTDGVAISLKLSQDEFADMLGCSRPTVNKELKQLERDGVIRITYSHFLILDVAALEAILAAL
jgi:CRP-like cAMP-binding protein